MAYLESFDQFDLRTVDLNWYDYYFEDSGLENDIYIDVAGVIYEDLFWVDGYDGFDWLELVFLGSGIAEDFAGNVVAGTVEFVGEMDLFTESLLWYVDGISVSAVAVYNAALTPSNQDEIAIIQTALAGDDTIFLSPFDDWMSGFDGNDDIDGGAGHDELYGGSGEDLFIGGAGNDFIAGEDGFDIVSYDDASAGVTVDLVMGIGRSTAGGDPAGIGVDTLSGIEIVWGSGFADHLTAASWDSSLFGGAGNDTLVGGLGWDDLIGEDGDDTLTGGFGEDRLIGDGALGTGNDTFIDTAAGLNQDTIVDFGAGDRIVISDASLSEFDYSLSGDTLTYTGGSLTLLAPVNGTIVASAAAGGGVQLTIQAATATDARNDFNGDGRSDVLWRNDSGSLSNWLGQANGGFTGNDANAFAQVSADWHVIGTGDFNGDGRDDILWRSDAGQMSNWLGTASGGWANNDANAFVGVPTDWQVSVVGDFNGDGKDDLLWRSDAGQMSNWLGTASGGWANNDANAFAQVSTDWHVIAAGDFNGDGRDDILWRSDAGQMSNWLGTANGGFASNDANAFVGVPNDWKVLGTGDFNGDGRDDILWRSDSGAMSNWLGTASGGWTSNDANAFANISLDWHIAQIGDFNGDGRDDVLWRSDAGGFSNWLGTASGGFTPNDANAYTNVPIEWHVQAPDVFLL